MTAMDKKTIDKILSLKDTIALCSVDAFALRCWKVSEQDDRAADARFNKNRHWPDKWLTPGDMFARLDADCSHGLSLLDFLFAAKTLHTLGLLTTNGVVYRPTMRGILWIARYDNGKAKIDADTFIRHEA